MTHLLDSSAFFAFFFDEPGRQRVEELFQDPSTSVGLSVLTAVEFWARLKAEGREEAFEQEWDDHLPLFEGLAAADSATCLRAVKLRRAATGRLPTIDSVIAASAILAGAILVHRDPHFIAIPDDLLKQEPLTD
jgi:predicted nucleic acid-binding protein